MVKIVGVAIISDDTWKKLEPVDADPDLMKRIVQKAQNSAPSMPPKFSLSVNLGVASLPEEFGSPGNVRHRIRNDEYH
jgi:hypothetical protein